MKTIVIINSGVLPIPPALGGAVENLTDFYLLKNEQDPIFRFVVYTPYNTKACAMVEKYRHVSFVFVQTNTWWYKIERVIRFFLNRLSSHYYGNVYIANVLRKIKKNEVRIDAIVLENAPEYVIPLSRKTALPIIQHLHNFYLHEDNARNREILKKSHLIISNSEFVQKNIIRVGNLVSRKSVLYNGIDTLRFSEEIQPRVIKMLKKQLGIPENRLVVLYSGRFQPHKGILQLIQAFLSMKNPCLHLLIIGTPAFSGKLDSEFVIQIKQLTSELSDYITYTGYIDYSEIYQYYQLADIGIFPSLCEEAFALTALESMASGVATIVSDAGGMPEVVGDAGLIVKRGKNMANEIVKSISLLVNDSTLRLQLAKAGKKQALKFDVSIYWSEFKKLLLNNI